MKKFFKITFALLAVVGMVACHSEKAQQSKSEVQMFQEGLNQNDTVQMLQLADDCMALLLKNSTEEALDMLYEYDDSTRTIAPLGPETRAAYQRKFSLFPVKKYVRLYYSFQLQGRNDVKYEVVFDEQPGNVLSKTSYMFNPVKVDGTWYLSVKTANQEIDRLRR